MHRFYARGQLGLDVAIDTTKISDEYKDIAKWTNRIDLTELVSDAMMDDGKVRLALMSPVNSTEAKMFFTKETDSISNSVMNVSDEDLIPQLILVYTPGTGESTLTAKEVKMESSQNTFVRKGSSSGNGISEAIEIYTYNDGNKKDMDFVGLLSFSLTDEVQKARAMAREDKLEVFSATLRLVTMRVKGNREMNVYTFNAPFNDNSTYAELENSIKETRDTAKYVTFRTAGQANKDITCDAGLTGSYKTSIQAWTNDIDVTELVKGQDVSTLRIMLSAPENARSPKVYFSSRAESFTNENNKDFIVAEEDLIPMLTISYRNPLYTDIDEVIEIPVSDSKIYDLHGNQIKTMGKGVYIVNGKKVLNK